MTHACNPITVEAERDRRIPDAHWPASQPTQRALGKKFCLKNKVDSTSGGMKPKVPPPQQWLLLSLIFCNQNRAGSSVLALNMNDTRKELGVPPGGVLSAKSRLPAGPG